MPANMKLGVSQKLWDYMSEAQHDLLDQGDHLLAHAKEDVENRRFIFNDYSFVVFPFAKAYEGFLKQLFLDAHYIRETDYTSDHFRVGKVLTPFLVKRLRDRSVYKKICDNVSCDFADRLWGTWKRGRNLVFHYYPHNLKSLALVEAEEIAKLIIATMEEAIELMGERLLKDRLARLGHVD